MIEEDRKAEDALRRVVDHRIAIHLVIISSIFTFLVVALLLENHYQLDQNSPLDRESLQSLQTSYRKNPQDLKIKEEYRHIDQQLRQEYFHRLKFQHTGGYLLVGGVIALLLSLQRLQANRRLRSAFPTEAMALSPSITRRGIALLGAIFVLIACGLGLLRPEHSIRKERGVIGKIPKHMSPAFEPVNQMSESWLRAWPTFRGPLGNGVSTAKNIPLTFDLKSKKNVRWVTNIPLEGFGSPIIWGAYIYVSGADKSRHQSVFCYDLKTGKLQWEAKVPPQGGRATKRKQSGGEAGLAAPTMVTDGQRVCAIFGTGDLACIDTQGKILWAKNIGVPLSSYGYASSLALAQSLLVIQYDNDENRKLFGFDIRTGTKVWETERNGEASWASPIVARIKDRWMILTSASPSVIAYNPDDGEELWRSEFLMGEIAPSPSWFDDSVYVVMENAGLAGISGTTRGTVSPRWKVDGDLPDTSSPLATKERIYVASSYGSVTCFARKTGQQLWLKEFSDGFYSSPTLVEGHIFLMDNKGVVWGFEDAEKYKQLGRSLLNESATSCPAFVDSNMVIRAERRLYCIGATE